MTSPDREGSASSGRVAKFASYFIDSRLTPIVVGACLLLGAFALWKLPREEEPQIEVPMVDVFASLPGASPAEIESRLTRPLEKLLWEVPGVEYLYSTSSPGQSLVIVRFEVGTPLEPALVRLRRRLDAHADRLPLGMGPPLVKPRTIDDVPILALTLHSASYDELELRRLAAQLEELIKPVTNVAETTLIGGSRRALRIQLDPAALAARQLEPLAVVETLRQTNRQRIHASRPFANKEIVLETGAFLQSVADAGALIVGLVNDRPVYLRDVAKLSDGGEELSAFVLHGTPDGRLESAVTLSVAKRPGANAVDVARAVMARVETARGALLPTEIGLTVTRDYGRTAAEKGNELLLHMGLAVAGVAVLILIFLGVRESAVVLLAIPTTLALTLLLFYLHGYTLNRITLFALIFSIGILVDDAIVVVENIVRHFHLPGASGRRPAEVALEAVQEVGGPTILATWAVIAAILPMAFVGGLMGPYMRPIPVGASAAMLFSLAIAFAVTPWATVGLRRRRHDAKARADPHHDQAPSDRLTRLYYRVMSPLLDRPRWRWLFFAGIGLLLAASTGLVLGGWVVVKMLPFDNKSELQIVLNTDEGTTLEQTTRIALEMAAALRTEPEVRDYQIYAGTASPFNFNGLVRHYFLRRGPNVADIQVNLAPKEEREAQSHAIAKRIRTRIAPIAARYGAVVAVAEVPPGPPVLQSLVAEIYGPDEPMRVALAREVRAVFARTEGVVDIDWYVEASQPKIRYGVDRDKAAFHGICVAAVAETLQLATQGLAADLLHAPAEREDVPIVFELPAAARSHPSAVLALRLRSASGLSVPLSELVRVETGTADRSLYRKNLRPVTYVTADVAGAVESPAYALFAAHRELMRLDARSFGASEPRLLIYHLNLPDDDTRPALKWDGEWHVTLEVFRDLGLAFAAVLLLIAVLMVGWFRSYLTPLVVMAAIPFSLIGILPAHAALGAFFTATSMIGFMAGAGIVVRNSIILVDFIELRRTHGIALREAVIEAGALRFRPMLLTALAVVVGASVILADPIFQGLAISLMFGEIASLLISRMAVPVLYFVAHRRGITQRD